MKLSLQTRAEASGRSPERGRGPAEELYRRSNPLAIPLRAIMAVFILLFATGCGVELAGTPTPTVVTPDILPTQGSVPATPLGSPDVTQAPAKFVRIWLPPQFDPHSGTPAAEILKSRLNLFLTLNPDVQIEVRIKAEDGPGGLLDSLGAANVAASLALPDLIVLSRPLLEIAAIKGYVKPLDSQALRLDEAGWYEYARQLGRLQDSVFGLPFAGEAQLVVFQGAETTQSPKTWQDVLGLDGVLGFPAGDPQALFTLAQYQAAGGSVQDAQGRPTLDETVLTNVLGFYQEAESAGIFPYWLTQFETDSQSWDAWSSGQFSFNVAWSTHLLQQPAESGLQASALPTSSGQPYTLARGWVWAVASPDAARQELALHLVKYLNDPSFLGRWTLASGYLPPHSAALAEWPDDPRRQFIEELVESAHLYPSENLLSMLGPILRQAALAVLRQQMDPSQAARQAMEMLK